MLGGRKNGNWSGHEVIIDVLRTCSRRSVRQFVRLSQHWLAEQHSFSRLLSSLDGKVTNLRARLTFQFKYGMTTLEKLSSNKAFGGELVKYKFKVSVMRDFTHRVWI